METYSFYKENSSIVIDYQGQANTHLPASMAYPYHQYDGIQSDDDEVFVFTKRYYYRISPLNDTVILDGVVINPGSLNVTDLAAMLRNSDVFLKPSTESGGGTGQPTTSASAITSGTLSDARLSPNVTKLGNTVNNANGLVKLDPSGKLPAVSGEQLINVPVPASVTNSLNGLTATVLNLEDKLQHDRGTAENEADIYVKATNPQDGDWIRNLDTDTVWLYDAPTETWKDSGSGTGNLTTDSVPAPGSINPVESGGTWNAIANAKAEVQLQVQGVDSKAQSALEQIVSGIYESGGDSTILAVDAEGVEISEDNGNITAQPHLVVNYDKNSIVQDPVTGALTVAIPNFPPITQAQYDALTAAEKNKSGIYHIKAS